ncbi:purine-binding chemotaxis protein CheW [bacterium]|nr:purine-binding chemotaxis protein CheW [bacterium]
MDTQHYVIFEIHHQRFALPLNRVRRIARSVSITPLPNAPESVLGLINVQGSVIPVVDIRKKFNLSRPEIRLDDHLIIGSTSRRMLALMVDSVHDIFEIESSRIIQDPNLSSGRGSVDGAIITDDNIILIQDLEKVLSADENRALDHSMKDGAGRPESEEKEEKGSGGPAEAVKHTPKKAVKPASPRSKQK